MSLKAVRVLALGSLKDHCKRDRVSLRYIGEFLLHCDP
jgi:hypothetical protein